MLVLFAGERNPATIRYISVNRDSNREESMPLMMQEARCPVCRAAWDLDPKDFVKLGDMIACKNGCVPFAATGETVLCTVEDADGLVQMPLREFPPEG